MLFAVAPFVTSTRLMGWVVCQQKSDGTWEAMRLCSEQPDAQYICELLTHRLIRPEDAANYRIPSMDVVGERIETVADLHRGRRRRRRR